MKEKLLLKNINDKVTSILTRAYFENHYIAPFFLFQNNHTDASVRYSLFLKNLQNLLTKN